MTPMEIALAGLTVMGVGVNVWTFVRVPRGRGRWWIVGSSLILGVAGLATVFGYHQLFCANYTLSGEFRRGSTAGEWVAFVLPLAVQIAAMGAGLRTGSRPEVK